MPESSLAPSKSRRRWFAPRFSLAAALFAMTLCAVGLWYWFRVPFEVVHESKNRTEIESVRRTWGGTVRHGPRRIIRRGKLTFIENYRDGIRHGKQEWFDAQGRAYITAEFQLGRLVKFQASDEYDQRLARHFAEGTIDNPHIAASIFEPAALEFVETPLKDAIQILKDTYNIPITCQGLRNNVTLEEPLPPPRPPSEVVRLNDQMQLLVPLDPDVPDTAIELQMLPVSEEKPKRPKVVSQINLPITADVREDPLIIALGKMLQPHDLVCDYRYGMLWVAEREGVENWKDPTGVAEIVPPPGSKLSRQWDNLDVAEFIETPLGLACAIISGNTNNWMTFDCSRLPSDFVNGKVPGSRVTINAQGLHKDILGMMLESVGCRARLGGETIVIELQPDHPLAEKR
jgi:hypothetical protein